MHNREISANIDADYRAGWADLIDTVQTSSQRDLRDLFALGPTKSGITTLRQIILSGHAFQKPLNLREELTEKLKSNALATTIYSGWKLERPYILRTVAEHGNCKYRDDRGPTRNRICKWLSRIQRMTRMLF